MSPRKVPNRRLMWLGSLILLVLISCSGVALWSFSSSCFFLSEKLCTPLMRVQARSRATPAQPARVKTDEELASLAVSQELLSLRIARSSRPKVAFLFLTRGPLPHELLWERFFQGYQGKYSIYVHASELGHSRKTLVFAGREILSQKVGWGKIDMIDAERRLLANALLDKDNEYFVLLSESCIPLWSFIYTYDYFINSSTSFVDCFHDPGPHGAGRYLEGMKPEVQKEDFCKGAQWFAVNRRHALLIVADSLYYHKFKNFCKPGKEFRNCYPDEHYIQTFLHIIDPKGISNWSVTYVDWRNQKWHPRSFTAKDIKLQLINGIQNITEIIHVSSDSKRRELLTPCMWNGVRRPCYLFARKFMEDTTTSLQVLFSNNSLI